MAQDSKRLEDAFAAAEKSYNEVKGAEVLKSTKELTDLNAAFTTLTTAKTKLINYLSDISSRYNAADTNVKATIVSAVGTKFTNFQSAYSAFYDKLGLANAYITSKIYGDLKQNITDLAGYKYIKDALGQTTDIDGGLVMTTLLALRDADGNVQSGINGAIDENRGKKSIATWWGGQMVDKDYNSGNLTPATSLVRFDGSGYLANGAIWWDVDGKVHADPTSFIISEKNLGAYLTFFEPTWKSGSAGTSVTDLVSLKPNAPFSELGVSGDAAFEGAITFHGIKLTYDSTNKAIKVDGNLYATGGISAYGASDAGGGGGLNASVISYARIIEGSYTDADLTSIPNAYAIKALSSRIDNIATELGGLNLSWNNITGKPSTFTPSAHKHKWADITDRITKVSQLTNDAGYLTTHQSLASYYTKTEIDAKGYTTNKGTVTSVSLTLPTGLTCATKTITTSGTFAISLASGYSIPTTAKQTAWDGAVSAKHTHSNKSVLDGISSTKVSHWDSAYGWYALMTTDEETADGIINKWNEVVSFLANIAQTDTLSGIVDGINKSISDEVTRAKGAEGVNASGISTNKTNITTLQGYFTSGSAKKALQLTNARKLWGNSFNGTADINGSIIVPSGKYISIGNIKMEYDATNKALKITNTTTDEVANIYTSGGVSAYGVGTSSSSGGGLNGSVKAYADAIKLTTENLSEIASAYSVAKLYSEIQNVASAVPSISVSVPTGGNVLTGATYNASTGVISFTKGTFLTAHQSLDGYVNAIAVSGSGNAVTAVTKSGKTITFTKGATYLTSHQSLAAYLKSADAASTYAVVGHTHKVTINGAEKTINPSTGTIVDLGTYLTSHQSLAAYLKSADAAKTYASINHTHSVKINGTTKIIAASGGTAVDLGTYLTAHQSLDGYVNTLTQPTETNVFVTAISKNGKTLTYTKSYTKKGATAVTDSGLKNVATDANIIPDMSFIALWNGAYSSAGSSNLKYCFRGTFGSFAIKNSLAFSELASKPTTIAGYGITDAYTKTQINTSLSKYLLLTGGTLSGDLVIGKIKLHYDSKNNAIAISHTDANTNANLYATGGIAAYGEGTSTSGGGLNGSVLSYASAIKLTSAGDNEISQIASAWSIAQLNSRIVSLEGGSALDVVTSGTGNAVTAISKNGTTINVTKGTNFLTSHQSLANYLTKTDASNTYLTKTAASSTYQPKGSYLTAHQSLDGYVNEIATSGTGNAITSVSKSGKKLTFTKGATFLTRHQSLSNYVTKGSVLADDINLDSVTTTGFYRASSLKTLPGYGQLLTIFAGGDTITQIYGALDGRLYTRGGNPTNVGGHGYWSNWNTIAYVGDNISAFANDSGYLTSHQDISGKADKSQLANYLSLSGGAMSGVLQLDTPSGGMTEPNTMRLFLNTSKYNGILSTPGIGFHIANTCWGNLRMESDTSLTWFNPKNDGYLPIKASGFVIGGVASDNYVLLAGGGHKTISSLSVNYANSAGSANSVAWTNVSGRPTKVSQFTNDSGYITSSGSCSYASSAGNADTVDGYHHTSFLKLAGGTMTGRLDFTPRISATGKYDEGMMWFGSIGHDLATNYYYYIPWFGGHDVVNNYGYGNTISVGAYHQQTSDCGMYIGMSWDGNAPDTFFRFSRSGNFLATGGITAYSSSDIRLKQDLRKLDYLGIIKAMGGTFGFAWKKDNTRSIGWIAQHVLCNPHLKDIVETDEKGYYKINYWSPKLIATAFGAIEQVGDEVSRLKARVVFLESEVQRLSGEQGDCDNKRLGNKNIKSLN